MHPASNGAVMGHESTAQRSACGLKSRPKREDRNSPNDRRTRLQLETPEAANTRANKVIIHLDRDSPASSYYARHRLSDAV